MENDPENPFTNTIPAPTGGDWTMGGLLGGLTGLATAAGSVIGAVRGNGAGQNTQASGQAQANAAATAARVKMMLWGGAILAGVVAIVFILRRGK